MTEWATYHVAPTANGCPGNVTDYTFYVSPVPVVANNPLSQTQCSGVNTNIVLTGNLPGMLFTWTVTADPVMSGFTSNAIPAILISDVLVNSGSIAGIVTYHITPIYNGCTGSPMDYSVVVQPVPVLSNSPPSQSQCSNTLTNVLTSSVAGALFTWTCTPSSVNITGWSNNAIPAVLLNQTLINSGNTIEWVTYHVAPTANGCPGPLADFTVTVYPVPHLTNVPLSQSQCDLVNTNINLTSDVAGTLFTWTCTPSSANITGWANNAVPMAPLTRSLTIRGLIIEWVTYHVAPTANGCVGPVTDYVVTVYPAPDLSNTPAAQWQCNNENTNIMLTSNVAGTQFTWTCIPSSGNITGWATMRFRQRS